MERITLDFAIKAALDAAALMPEGYVYTNPDGEVAVGLSLIGGGISCSYFDDKDGSPSCLVGYILHAAGITAQHIPAGHSGSGSHTLVEELEECEGLMVDTDASSFMRTIQNLQDSGVPWDDAIKEGISVHL
jgi:hypothetical protein